MRDEVVVLMKNLKAIVGGNVRLGHERVVDGVADFTEKFVRFAFAEVNMNERHSPFSLCCAPL
jgi:hypothetical protein